MARQLIAAASLALTANAAHYIDAAGDVHLKMNPAGNFKIMQLTDLHFGENDKRDAATARAVKDWVEKEEPDFIAVTGDLISGFYWDQKEHIAEFWGHHHKMFVFLMNEINVPWGFVPGDHDFEADADQFMMLQLEAMDKLSATKENHYKLFGQEMFHQFTYMVPIEHADDPETAVARAWFFGTGRSTCLGRPGKDCIRRGQLHWYKRLSQSIPADDKYRKNGIAFMHHALQEHMFLVNNFPVHGSKRDYSGCQAINTGLYGEIRQ